VGSSSAAVDAEVDLLLLLPDLLQLGIPEAARMEANGIEVAPAGDFAAPLSAAAAAGETGEGAASKTDPEASDAAHARFVFPSVMSHIAALRAEWRAELESLEPEERARREAEDAALDAADDDADGLSVARSDLAAGPGSVASASDAAASTATGGGFDVLDTLGQVGRTIGIAADTLASWLPWGAAPTTTAQTNPEGSAAANEGDAISADRSATAATAEPAHVPAGVTGAAAVAAARSNAGFNILPATRPPTTPASPSQMPLSASAFDGNYGELSAALDADLAALAPESTAAAPVAAARTRVDPRRRTRFDPAGIARAAVTGHAAGTLLALLVASECPSRRFQAPFRAALIEALAVERLLAAPAGSAPGILRAVQPIRGSDAILRAWAAPRMTARTLRLPGIAKLLTEPEEGVAAFSTPALLPTLFELERQPQSVFGRHARTVAELMGAADLGYATQNVKQRIFGPLEEAKGALGQYFPEGYFDAASSSPESMADAVAPSHNQRPVDPAELLWGPAAASASGRAPLAHLWLDGTPWSADDAAPAPTIDTAAALVPGPVFADALHPLLLAGGQEGVLPFFWRSHQQDQAAPTGNQTYSYGIAHPLLPSWSVAAASAVVQTPPSPSASATGTSPSLSARAEAPSLHATPFLRSVLGMPLLCLPPGAGYGRNGVVCLSHSGSRFYADMWQQRTATATPAPVYGLSAQEAETVAWCLGASGRLYERPPITLGVVEVPRPAPVRDAVAASNGSDVASTSQSTENGRETVRDEGDDAAASMDNGSSGLGSDLFMLPIWHPKRLYSYARQLEATGGELPVHRHVAHDAGDLFSGRHHAAKVFLGVGSGCFYEGAAARLRRDFEEAVKPSAAHLSGPSGSGSNLSVQWEWSDVDDFPVPSNAIRVDLGLGPVVHLKRGTTEEDESRYFSEGDESMQAAGLPRSPMFQIIPPRKLKAAAQRIRSIWGVKIYPSRREEAERREREEQEARNEAARQRAAAAASAPSVGPFSLWGRASTTADPQSAPPAAPASPPGEFGTSAPGQSPRPDLTPRPPVSASPEAPKAAVDTDARIRQRLLERLLSPEAQEGPRRGGSSPQR
jgi:hypothetical protein